MHETGEHREFSPRGRAVITALLLVLPAACLALAVTSPPGSETAWLLIAAANLVLPAVILPLVWRGALRGRASGRRAQVPAEALPAREPSLS